MKRRALLQALPAIAVGGALSSAAAASPTIVETPFRRVQRLQRQLAGALAELAGQDGGFGPSYVSIVKPDLDGYGRVLVEREAYDHDQDRMANLSRIEIAAVEWQLAMKAKEQALAAYDDAAKANTVRGVYHPLPLKHPARSAWMEADDEATRSQHRVLRLVADAVKGWG